MSICLEQVFQDIEGRYVSKTEYLFLYYGEPYILNANPNLVLEGEFHTLAGFLLLDVYNVL